MSQILIYKVFYGLAIMIQGLLISGSFMLSYLAKSKAGLMRHIYTKRLVYEQGFLYSDKINLIVYLFIFLSILILIISSYKKQPIHPFEKFQIFIFTITVIFTLFVIKSDFYISMLSHPYILIAFLASCFIQFLFLFALFINKKSLFHK